MIYLNILIYLLEYLDILKYLNILKYLENSICKPIFILVFTLIINFHINILEKSNNLILDLDQTIWIKLSGSNYLDQIIWIKLYLDQILDQIILIKVSGSNFISIFVSVFISIFISL